jgi:hypothetical protein
MAQVPGGSLAKSNGTTAVDIIGSPAASTQRIASGATLFNNDSIPHVVRLQVTDGMNTSVLDEQTIDPRGRYMWGTGRETQVLDSTTKKMQFVLAEAKASSDCDCTGTWLDNS